MPTRLIREGIIDSERVNRLSIQAELFYRRLLSVVDDYGRFDARPTLLRVRCYPLRVDQVGDNQLVDWLTECVNQGLVRLYAKNGKPQTEALTVAELSNTITKSSKRPYLEVQDFKQKIRAKSSKFPDPPAGIPNMYPVDAGQTQYTSQTCDGRMQDTCLAYDGQMRTEAETESKVLTGGLEAQAKTKALTGGSEAKGAEKIQSAGPPVDKSSKPGHRPYFEGIAEPRPDTLDAAYDKVTVPEILDDEDSLWAIEDPIILAMAVTRDRKSQSWLGWVGMANKARKMLGRKEADRRWWALCIQFWHEVQAGEKPDRPGAALTARLTKELGLKR